MFVEAPLDIVLPGERLLTPWPSASEAGSHLDNDVWGLLDISIECVNSHLVALGTVHLLFGGGGGWSTGSTLCRSEVYWRIEMREKL